MSAVRGKPTCGSWDEPHRVAALLVDDHTCGVALVPGLYVQSPSSPVQGVLLTEVNKLHSHYLRKQGSLLSACGTEYPDLYKKHEYTSVEREAVKQLVGPLGFGVV